MTQLTLLQIVLPCAKVYRCKPMPHTYLSATLPHTCSYLGLFMFAANMHHVLTWLGTSFSWLVLEVIKWTSFHFFEMFTKDNRYQSLHLSVTTPTTPTWCTWCTWVVMLKFSSVWFKHLSCWTLNWTWTQRRWWAELWTGTDRTCSNRFCRGLKRFEPVWTYV